MLEYCTEHCWSRWPPRLARCGSSGQRVQGFGTHPGLLGVGQSTSWGHTRAVASDRAGDTCSVSAAGALGLRVPAGHEAAPHSSWRSRHSVVTDPPGHLAPGSTPAASWHLSALSPASDTCAPHLSPSATLEPWKDFTFPVRSPVLARTQLPPLGGWAPSRLTACVTALHLRWP